MSQYKPWEATIAGLTQSNLPQVFNPLTKTGRSPAWDKRAVTAKPEPPKTRAQLLFQGQLHPKKKKKIIRLEQWVEIRIRKGQTITTLYPSNEKLIERGQKMLPPPEFVYRRLNFPDGIPIEYYWTGVYDERHRRLGGCAIQRMTIEGWLTVIDREKLRTDGHIGPTPFGSLPRPKEHGSCTCHMCTRNQAVLDTRFAYAEARGLPTDLDSLLALTSLTA